MSRTLFSRHFRTTALGSYLSDFAVVTSFALNCFCSPDIDLARRLTSGKKGLATRASPHEFVSRFFEPELWCKPEEEAFLQTFVGQLIGLPRQTYLGVIRAIRTYINGMHRIADDLELAYTLLVASVESLAQDFDGHESDWASYEERKRLAVDEALIGADAAALLVSVVMPSEYAIDPTGVGCVLGLTQMGEIKKALAEEAAADAAVQPAAAPVQQRANT